MRLLTLQKDEPTQEQINREVNAVQRYYLDRVGVPRKLRQYEAKSALMKISGFSPEKATKTIVQWNAIQKQQRLQTIKEKQPVSRSVTISPAKSSNRSSWRTKQVQSLIKPSKIQGSDETAKLSLEEQFLAMGLISNAQLEIARMEKITSRKNGNISSILVEKGWVKAQTVGFLKVILPKMRSRQISDLAISDYLQQAGLLSHSQVIEINQEIQDSSLSFSEAAIERGWVKQKSIDFISTYLNLNFSKRMELKVGNDKDSLGEKLMALLTKEIF